MTVGQLRIKQANESIGGKVDRVTGKKTWFMGGRSVAILTAMFLVCSGTAAWAVDDAADAESKLDKFKMKVSSSQPKNAKKKAVEGDNAGAQAVLEFSGGASPLGMAGNLPVKGGAMGVAGGQAVPQTPEELQAQMEIEAEQQRQKMKEETFNAALRNILPLSPAQIRQTYNAFEKSREAAETPIRMPDPKVRVSTISLDPGQSPIVIKLAPGFVTTIAVLDSTGAPWPIQDVVWTGKFEVMPPPEQGGNIVRISSMSAHGAGNISMRLVDLITPVVFTMKASLDDSDYRLDLRVPKPGPLTKVPLIEHGGLTAVAGTDDSLIAVMDGVAPAQSDKLDVQGVDGRTSAWKVNSGCGCKIYLRTPLTLLSPAWDSSVVSADGTNVYTISDTPVVLLADEGRMVKAYIKAGEVKP